MYVCMCVCVEQESDRPRERSREREREREIVCLRVCVRKREGGKSIDISAEGI